MLSTGYKLTMADDAGTQSCTFELGDLYAEDEKDLLVQLRLPALGARRDATPHGSDWEMVDVSDHLADPSADPAAEPVAVLRAVLRYFSVAGSKMVEVESTLKCARPLVTPEGQEVPHELDIQRNRLRVAAAMAQAADLADRGQLDQGRNLLAKTLGLVRSSSTASSPASLSLVAEMEELSVNYANDVVYRSLGSKMSKMQAMSHCQQRSSHASGQMYEKRGKGIAKARMLTPDLDDQCECGPEMQIIPEALLNDRSGALC